MSDQEYIQWDEEKLTLLADKALFWPVKKALFVADPHFGKTATFRRSGIPVPERTTQGDCERISQLLSKTNAKILIFLGDFFHSRIGKTELVKEILLHWRQELPDLEIHLIRGNHDLSSGDPWPELKIKCHPDPWTFSTLECRHLPVEQSSKPYLAGHIHPGFTLKGKGKASIRAACFHINQSKIILPAFGSFTGLKNVNPIPGDQIFMTNGNEIYEVPFQ